MQKGIDYLKIRAGTKKDLYCIKNNAIKVSLLTCDTNQSCNWRETTVSVLPGLTA